MKKLLAMIILVVTTLSCSLQNVGMNESMSAMNTEASSGYGEGNIVKLIKASSYSTYHYGIPYNFQYLEVKVKNLGFEKEIFIHGEEYGEWVDVGAFSYKESVSNDYEIWTLRLGSGVGKTRRYDGEFVIKYNVGGQTYWDNNNEQNYVLDNHDGVMLGNDVNVKLDTSVIHRYSDIFSGSIDVQNLGYIKDVSVVYTTDNWATTQVVRAIYNKWYHIPYSSSIPSPNSKGVERWTFAANIAEATDVEYAISYEVNGNIYWDNNHSGNYTLKR